MFLSFAHRPKFALVRKVVSSIMTVAFLTSLSAPAGAQLASLLPTPGSAVTISPVFVPPTLKGLNIHPENPFLFDFIVGRGDDKIEGMALKAESEKLVKFFLTAMTIPDKEAWVNLSPYEANRIIPDALGKTEMGKVMLEQDYLLKQLASSLTNPDTDLGKKFWNDVRAKAKEKFGTTDIPMSTFNKVWIVPSKAEVAEKDGKVFITRNSLKVMLEEDYDAMQRNLSQTAEQNLTPPNPLFKKEGEKGNNSVTLSSNKTISPSTSSLDKTKSLLPPSLDTQGEKGNNSVALSSNKTISPSTSSLDKTKSLLPPSLDKEGVGGVLKPSVQPSTSSLSSEVFRSTILPTIEKEINEGKNFAAVRQIYDAAILAVWYKSALKESLLGKIYADKSKVKGIETDAVGFKEEVYKKYVEAFKKGAYNMIKEDFDMSKDEAVPTRYFSGGMSTAYLDGVVVSSGVTEVVVKSDDVVVRVLNAEEKPEADVLAKGVAQSAGSAVSSPVEQAFLTLDAKMADIEQNGSGKTKEEIVNEILSMLTQEDNRDHSIEVFRALQLEVGNSYSKVEFLNDNLGSRNPNIGTLRTALSDTDVYETLVSIIRNDDNRLGRFLNLKRVIDQVEEQWKDQDLPSGSVMYMVINTWLDSAELRNDLQQVIFSVNKSKLGLLKVIFGQFERDTSTKELIANFSHSQYMFYDYFRDYVKAIAKNFNKAIAQRATTRAANNLGRSMSESASVSLSSEPLDVLTLVIKRWISNSGNDLQQILKEAGKYYQLQKKRWEFVRTLLDKIISGELLTTDSLEFFLVERGVAKQVLDYLLEIGDNELSSEESEAVKALMAEVRNVAKSNDSRFLNEKIRGIIQIWQNPTNRQSLRLVLDKMVLESTQMATEFEKLSRIPVAAQKENESEVLNVLISSGELYRSALMNFVAAKSSSSAVEDNLDKYVMDLLAKNLSYEQMYKAFESRYNTNRRLLQDVANNFLLTKDEKTGAPLAVDYKQAYQMALGQISETDKLFLLFFEDVNKRVDALKAEGQSEEQAINVVLEKEVQRIQNVQKIEQERLTQIAQRKQQLRDKISQLLPSIIQKLLTEVKNATASLSAAANQSQRDAAIRSEIQRQYDALKAGVEKRVRQINFGKDLATMHILPGQALRRAISELSLQDQILYQLFPEVQKQMENMTRSNPSANDKFERALKAAEEGTIQKTIVASSPLPIEEQAKQNLAKKLGFSSEDTPSVQEVEQRYRDIAQGRYKTESAKNDAEIRTDMKLFDSIEMEDGEFYEMLVGQEIDKIDQSPEMLAILDKVARELEAAKSISPDVSGSTQVGGEKSASSQVGGINFDPTLMNLQVKRDKNGVPLPLFQQDLPNINIEGLYPVIINIAPATMANFPLLSKAEEQKQRIPSIKDDLSPIDRQKALKDRVGKKV